MLNTTSAKRESAVSKAWTTDGPGWLEKCRPIKGEPVKKHGDERKVEIAHVEAEVKRRKVKHVRIS
ncbi:MAG: hypothetical protein ACJAVK_002566 [Akkermansiaceae bacterium]|jgi:hypothetical protein